MLYYKTNAGTMLLYLTGAAGFLASHLVERLLCHGHLVVGIDNFVTGDKRNLAGVATHPNFALVQADASEAWTDVFSAMPQRFTSPDIVVHAASPASPVDYGNDPLGTMHINALGTIQAVNFARAANAQVFFFSTSECYGDPLEHPQRETYWGNVNPVGMRACYDESKRFGEAYLTSAARVYGLDARIVRIFNTYGPRMQANDGRVVPNFCLSALRGEPLTIYGDGLQTRSFCYVDDLVDGIFRFILSPRATNRIINLGNPVEFTIRELARIVSEIAGVRINVIERQLPPDDPSRRRPDITIARALLEWEPAISLPEGLGKTLHYFRTSREENV